LDEGHASGGSVKRPLSLALLLVLAPDAAQAADEDGWEDLRQPAKVFVLQDLDGKALRSTQLAGKVVVVDFWATWCAPCIKELPDLSAYHERLRSRTDVAFLSFNVTDEHEALLGFVKQKKVGFPVYKADALIGAYELTVFPTKLVIDMRGAKAGQPGVVRFRREGAAPVASIEARVAEVLAERP
jgi:thiol-disulfide isomerase/thioredoxin